MRPIYQVSLTQPNLLLSFEKIVNCPLTTSKQSQKCEDLHFEQQAELLSLQLSAEGKVFW